MDPDARLLCSFLVLAEELHFGRAAARLFVAQSSLSHQIRSLERTLGVVLFERSTRRVRLTEAGEQLAADVREPLLALRRAVTHAQRIGRGDAGSFRVGFVGSAANELTQPILRAFEQRAPDSVVELFAVPITDPTAGVLDGSADVGFVRDFRGHDALDAVEVLREPRVYVMAAGHEYAARASLTAADLAGEPTIALVPDLAPELRDTWAERAAAEGGARPVGGTAASIDSWLALIAAGRGITTAPASTARFFARPGLCFVPAADAADSVVSLAWRRDRRTPMVAAFVTAALEHTAGDDAGRPQRSPATSEPPPKNASKA